MFGRGVWCVCVGRRREEMGGREGCIGLGEGGGRFWREGGDVFFCVCVCLFLFLCVFLLGGVCFCVCFLGEGGVLVWKGCCLAGVWVGVWVGVWAGV